MLLARQLEKHQGILYKEYANMYKVVELAGLLHGSFTCSLMQCLQHELTHEGHRYSVEAHPGTQDTVVSAQLVFRYVKEDDSVDADNTVQWHCITVSVKDICVTNGKERWCQVQYDKT